MNFRILGLSSAALLVVAIAAYVIYKFVVGSNGADDDKEEPPSVPIRLSIVVEIDEMICGSDDTCFDQNTTWPNQSKSIADVLEIYRSAGLDLRFVNDDVSLSFDDPDDGKVNVVTDSEAIAIARSHADEGARENESKVYILLAHTHGSEDDDGLVAKRISGLSGVTGFIVWRERLLSAYGEQIGDGFQFMLAHELAHAVNLHHEDYEGGFWSNGTVESYSALDTVQWRLSSQSVVHIQDHPLSYVDPAQLVFNDYTEQHAALHHATTPGAAGALEVPKLRLTLAASKREFLLNEPIIFDCSITNVSTSEASLIAPVAPKYGFLRLEVRKPGSPEFVPIDLPDQAEARGNLNSVLEPGRSIEEDCPAFLSQRGWVFTEVGSYDVRAVFDDKLNVLFSETLTVSVSVPSTPEEVQGFEVFEDSVGEPFDMDKGLYLYFGGRGTFPEAYQDFVTYLQDQVSPYSTVPSLVVAQDIFNSRATTTEDLRYAADLLIGIDIGTAPRSRTESTFVRGAAVLLDAGMPAVAQEVSNRIVITTPDPSQDGEQVSLPSDTVYFASNSCVSNDADILREWRSLERPIACIVGHADVEDTDTYNCNLAWARALEVKNQLGNIAVDARIQSHGERNPTDSGLSPEALAANRRVEISLGECKTFDNLCSNPDSARVAEFDCNR